MSKSLLSSFIIPKSNIQELKIFTSYILIWYTDISDHDLLLNNATPALEFTTKLVLFFRFEK